MRHSLRVHYGGSLRLAQCVIDNAMEGRGMTVDLDTIDKVMCQCRLTLNLPGHVHPRVRQQPPEELAEKNATDDSEADSGEERQEEQTDQEESDDDDDVDENDWAPTVRLPLFDAEDVPRCFEARRAIAALLAVAEWLHRNCATTVVVSTVQQGPVLERTVTASSDALRQLDPDAAATAPTAAAMVVSSVARWFIDMERSNLSMVGWPVGSPSLLQESQQLWDRIIRWALDPALNAALLTTLPVPRDDVIWVVARAEASPWASAAAQEVLASVPTSVHSTLNRSKRPRSSRE